MKIKISQNHTVEIDLPESHVNSIHDSDLKTIAESQTKRANRVNEQFDLEISNLNKNMIIKNTQNHTVEIISPENQVISSHDSDLKIIMNPQIKRINKIAIFSMLLRISEIMHRIFGFLG